jgi:hypothetical protein
MVTQSSNGIEDFAAVPDNRDAEVREVLRRQVWQDRLVYIILAEFRLVPPEAQAPQPDHDVHYVQPQGLPQIIVRS